MSPNGGCPKPTWPGGRSSPSRSTDRVWAVQMGQDGHTRGWTGHLFGMRGMIGGPRDVVRRHRLDMVV